MRDDAATIDDVLGHSVTQPDMLGRFLAQARIIWSHGDLPWLSDLPIGRRFGLLVGLAVLGAVSFGTVYSLAEGRIDTMLVTQDGYRRLNDLAGDVRAKAAALRNHEEQFLRERDLSLAVSFRQDAEFIAQSLDAMAALPEAGAMAGSVTELKGALASVSSRFDAVTRQTEILGLTESSGLRGQLAASVKAIEDELKMWPNAGPLLPDMLQMRQAEKNFMLYGSEDSLNLHRKYANQFDFALDGSTLPKSTREDFRQLLATYSNDMRAFAEGSVAMESEVVLLRKQFQSMQPKLTQMFAYAREGMTRAIQQQEAVRAETSGLVAGFGLLAVVSFFSAALVLARSITQPVRLIESAMERLANGDHGVVVPGITRRDEIGDMAKAVAVFKDNAIAMVRLQQEQDAIRSEAEATSRQRMLALADHFEVAVKSVADTVSRNSLAIKETAEHMARGEGGESGSLTVAEAAEQARTTVAAVAEAANEMTASVDDIASHVSNVAEVVRLAVSELDRTNARVQGLAAVAGNIDRVVNLIGDIAARTNMLSLNATIEAQRAGEAGKGFAVVAGEVKHLANQTGESTREIAQQVAAISDVGDAIRRMDEIAGQVAGAVARQAEVTAKIGRCVEEVTADTRTVTDGVVAVTQSAARYCGSAVRVMWAADDLAGPASMLTQEVDGFLRTIRA
ncbi:MAG: methyl-accepting chemotaxis protein [Rhodospirillaceae bacterium]|nr:methyl-accepting chemotaxis protein [Rhodospirillales bacterium]